ncbi:MAG: transcriptional coactivator p15/PC4 family protein [Xanthobacteraceae bacterium]
MATAAELPITVGEWVHSESETLRLTIEEYQGRRRADLRIWYTDPKGKLHPTRRGVAIPLRRIKSVTKGLRGARAQCLALGLIKRKRR